MTKSLQILSVLGALSLASQVFAADVDIPNQFAPNTPARAADVNENFSAVETAVDDNAAGIAGILTSVGELGAENTMLMQLLQGLTLSVGVLEAENATLTQSLQGLTSSVGELETENVALTQLLQGITLSTTLNPVIDTAVNPDIDDPHDDTRILGVGDYYRRAEGYGLLRFDIGEIPAGATIISAELRLWKEPFGFPTGEPIYFDTGYYNDDIDVDICVQMVTSDWDETVVFNTAPTMDGPCIGSEVVTEDTGLFYWHGLGGLVQSWLADSNFGLAVVLREASPQFFEIKQFSSSEGTYKPELLVRYKIL